MTATMTLREAKSQLKQVLARVQAGESVILTRGNGQPVAKIVPVEAGDLDGADAVPADAAPADASESAAEPADGAL